MLIKLINILAFGREMDCEFSVLLPGIAELKIYQADNQFEGRGLLRYMRVYLNYLSKIRFQSSCFGEILNESSVRINHLSTKLDSE